MKNGHFLNIRFCADSRLRFSAPVVLVNLISLPQEGYDLISVCWFASVSDCLSVWCLFNSPNFNSPNSNYRVRIRVRDRVRLGLG